MSRRSSSHWNTGNCGLKDFVALPSDLDRIANSESRPERIVEWAFNDNPALLDFEHEVDDEQPKHRLGPRIRLSLIASDAGANPDG